MLKFHYEMAALQTLNKQEIHGKYKKEQIDVYALPGAVVRPEVVQAPTNECEKGEYNRMRLPIV